MERNIDMGLAMEDAYQKAVKENGCNAGETFAKSMFRAGAEWQAKQSSWISVKERLPKENEMVLCRMVSNGAIVSGYIVVEAGKPPRVATSGNFEFEDYGDYECDMWSLYPTLGNSINRAYYEGSL